MILPIVERIAFSSFHLFSISITLPDAEKIQKKLYDYLKSNGILTNLHYLPVHLHPIENKASKLMIFLTRNYMQNHLYLYLFIQTQNSKARKDC